jgi:mycofactocin system glycosyltransferase
MTNNSAGPDEGLADVPAPPGRNDSDDDFLTTVPLAWTPGVAFRDATVTIGGSPWTVTSLPDDVLPLARKLHALGRGGAFVKTPEEKKAAVYLLDLGIIDPVPQVTAPVSDVEIVVPVYRDWDALDRCLDSLVAENLPIVVVDDASPEPFATAIRDVVEAHDARLIVRAQNGGPGAARNTGFAQTTAPFVAFVDSDVVASPDWISRLRPLLNDPMIGAVAPRVRPDVQGDSAIELYEETRSELDMGAVPSRVVYGVPVGWLPSASVIVRRSASSNPPFEPEMRVGEDVDLFWRMEEAGWTVRYAPDVVNHHKVRTSLKDFSSRRASYGGSAAPLEIRHKNRLIPARPSLTGLGVLAALAVGRPGLALGIAGYELARQRQILDPSVSLPVAAEMAGRTIWSDVFWLGHLLRRDWWPVGLLVLLLTPKSRLARAAAVAMSIEPVRDHLLSPTRLDPVRSLALRALDDASYGTGVIGGALRWRVLNVVAPRIRVPWWPFRSQKNRPPQ